uniref:Alkyl transferase n=1 Tax=Tetraselmis sp. GSL018 TaxID=582737 RepID=A0A061RBN5_9CHLO
MQLGRGICWCRKPVVRQRKQEPSCFGLYIHTKPKMNLPADLRVVSKSRHLLEREPYCIYSAFQNLSATDKPSCQHLNTAGVKRRTSAFRLRTVSQSYGQGSKHISRRGVDDKKTSTNIIQPLNLPQDTVPNHIAIIMDGNARWAQRNRAEIRAGHERGVPALRETVRCCVAWGIEALTVYAFSSENWARGEPEVAFLMQLMARTLRADAPELAEQGVRVSVIGDREPLPGSLRREIDRAEELTRGCPRLHLSIAINYGGRQAIAAAASAVARAHTEAVTDREIGEELRRASRLPSDPDLLIRTSGERRLSNFLLWEAAYSELHFTETLWPDFGEDDLRAAIRDYASQYRMDAETAPRIRHRG